MPDWTIVAARLLQFGAALVLFGSPLFYLYGLRGGDRSNYSHLGYATVLAAALGLLGGVLWWIAAQTRLIFPDAEAFDWNASSILLTETQFGRAAALRAGLAVMSLIGLALLSPGKVAWAFQVAVASAIVASFAWTGHGVRDQGIEGLIHTGGDVLHLISAGIWIGALVPLSLLILRSLRSATEADASAAHAALEKFSGVGPGVVAVLILTGLVNSWFLIGLAQWRELFTSAYGLTLLLKIGLFGGMLLLAAANRFWLSPRLGAALGSSVRKPAALRALRNSILSETGLALLVLAVIAVLGTLEPPAAE